MRSSRHRRFLAGAPLLSAVCLFFGWQCVAMTNLVPRYMLPPPMIVLKVLYIDRGSLTSALLVTLGDAVVGFAIAIAIAAPLGILLQESKIADRAITPLLGVLQSIPLVAVAPLIVLWFGAGALGRVFLAALVGFFPIILGLIVGFRSAEPDTRMLMLLLKAGRLERYRFLLLPSAAPSIFAGIKAGIALCLVGAIVAEFLIPVGGLGKTLVVGAYQLNVPLMFAAVILTGALAISLVAVVGAVERKIIFWHTSLRDIPNLVMTKSAL